MVWLDDELLGCCWQALPIPMMEPSGSTGCGKPAADVLRRKGLLPCCKLILRRFQFLLHLLSEFAAGSFLVFDCGGRRG